MQDQIILPLCFIFCQECVELRWTIHLLHMCMMVYYKSFLHFHILAPDTKGTTHCSLLGTGGVQQHTEKNTDKRRAHQLSALTQKHSLLKEKHASTYTWYNRQSSTGKCGCTIHSKTFRNPTEAPGACQVDCMCNHIFLMSFGC